MYTNARSVVNKINDLKSYVLTINCDVVCLTEAWTNSNISNHYLTIPGYQLVSHIDRNDTHNGRGGGILIYIKDGLKVNESPIACDFNQYAGIQINTATYVLNLFVIYRSPNSTNENKNAYDRFRLNQM